MIYVTAGGGHVGRELVQQLAKAGQQVRALIGTADDAKALEGANVEVAVGDRARPETYAKSLEGCDTAMLFTRNGPDLPSQDAAFCKAAGDAGVRRIVKFSAFRADPNDPEPGAKRVHGQSEEAVKDSGLVWTILRPQFFMQNLIWFADEVRTQGSFSLPMGSGRVGMIDFRDIAAVAVKCLTEPGHEDRTYNLSGPALISCNDIAGDLSAAIGKHVSYRDVPAEAFSRFLVSMGRPQKIADEITVSYVAMSKGASAVLTEDVKKVLGRAPTPFSQVARDYAHLFK